MNTCKRVLSVVFFAIVLSACSTIPPPKDPGVIGHVIMIGRDGGLEKIDPDKKILLDPGQYFIDGYFDNILDGIKTFPKNGDGKIEVVIYVHGGLNTKNTSLKRVQEKYPKIINSNKYPIFINWRSGPKTTYSEHLIRVRQGEVSQYARFSSPIYLLTDIGNSIINAPKAWFVQGEHSFNSNYRRDDSGLDDFGAYKDHILFTGNSKKISSFWSRAQWLVTSPVKVLTTPFTFTLPKPAWDIMVRRTNTLFITPSEFQKINNSASLPSKSGALSEFLEKLEHFINAENLPVEITLIGHSMGTIVVNKMIKTAPELPYRNIVHMASGDSTRNLMESIVPYIQTHDVEFYSLSLHPKNEDREVSAFGLTPSGSLLVWIDNMFTTPETVMDRRSGRWNNMERVIHMIPKDALNKMHFKIFGIGNPGEPQEHGQFDDYNFWDESYWWE